jgi:DeoR/GlpR family transcriptional regulator of sugar metabolism
MLSVSHRNVVVMGTTKFGRSARHRVARCDSIGCWSPMPCPR